MSWISAIVMKIVQGALWVWGVIYARTRLEKRLEEIEKRKEAIIDEMRGVLATPHADAHNVYLLQQEYDKLSTEAARLRLRLKEDSNTRP